jgi:hypothetical protein
VTYERVLREDLNGDAWSISQLDVVLSQSSRDGVESAMMTIIRMELAVNREASVLRSCHWHGWPRLSKREVLILQTSIRLVIRDRSNAPEAPNDTVKEARPHNQNKQQCEHDAMIP